MGATSENRMNLVEGRTLCGRNDKGALIAPLPQQHSTSPTPAARNQSKLCIRNESGRLNSEHLTRFQMGSLPKILLLTAALLGLFTLEYLAYYAPIGGAVQPSTTTESSESQESYVLLFSLQLWLMYQMRISLATR